jgi:starvation-inducible DNA-binding protein
MEVVFASGVYAMVPSRIDIPVDIRGKLIDLLNQRLADMIDLKLQAKQAHWNVKGPNFIALHKLFDEIAEEVDEHADTIAERATALGGIVDGTAHSVAKTSKLKPYPTTIIKWRDHVEALANALATAGKTIRASIDQADELGDKDTADVFTEVSRELDKNLWFVEAHVQAEA